jgi:hypothetical protein
MNVVGRSRIAGHAVIVNAGASSYVRSIKADRIDWLVRPLPERFAEYDVGVAKVVNISDASSRSLP